MKKIAVLIIAVLVLSCFAACEKKSPCAKGHDFVYTSTGDATCTENAKDWLQCTRCGQIASDEIPNTARGHSFAEGYCTVCGYADVPENVHRGLLLYTLNDEGKGYTVKADGTLQGAVEILSTLYDLPVVGVDENGFKDQIGMTDIFIPSCVKTIGKSAFEGCTGLTVLNLDGVKRMGGRAFFGCTGLTEVTIARGLEQIDSATFGGCGAIRRLVIPFVGHLYAINYNPYDTGYTLGFIFGTKNYSGAQKVTMRHNAISNGHVKLVNTTYYIPASLSYVEITVGNLRSVYGKDVPYVLDYGAFHNCTMIKELVLSPEIETADSYAFEGMSGLEKLSAPGLTSGLGYSETMPALVELDCGLATLKPEHFPELSRFTWRDASGERDFSKAALLPKLSELTVGFSAEVETVKSEWLASVSDKLVGLMITSVDTTIEEGLLSSITTLKKAALLPTMLEGLDLQYLEDLTLLANAPYTVSATQFADAKNLKTLTLDARVTAFEEGAFVQCSLLSRVVFDGTKENLVREELLGRWLSIFFGGVGSNPLTHGAALYFGIENDTLPLGNVTLPEELVTLGAYVFDGCSNLTALAFGRSVTAIGAGAFANTVALKRVEFNGTLTEWCGIVFADGGANPVNGADELILAGEKLTALGADLAVTAIPAYAFCGYQGLTKVTAPSALTKIGTGAFLGCSALTDLSLPEGLLRIGALAFEGCTALTAARFGQACDWACFSEGSVEGGSVVSSDMVKDPASAAQYLTLYYADCTWEKMG